MERARRSGAADTWLVLDSDLRVFVPARDWVVALEAAGRSENTLKSYVPYVAMFLNYCHDSGIDWAKASLRQLVLLRHLVESSPTRYGRPPAPGTVSLMFTAIHSFLQYAASSGLMGAAVFARLSTDSTFIDYLRPGQLEGEQGQFRRRNGRSSALRVSNPRRPPEALSSRELDQVFRASRTARDDLLVQLMLDTGVRIGEAIGLHRGDMHFLSDSTSLGCRICGPHVHVLRRRNENGAWAKSVHPRAVPVTDEVVDAYRVYQFERHVLVPDDCSEFVFINLYFTQNRTSPLRYRNAKRCFDRLARKSGVEFRPHMLRHTYVTDLMDGGVDIATVAELAGHASLASTAVYRHTSDAGKREALTALQAARSRTR
ncbi:hypothetical protein N802_18235 [Knoellia sinensis KCTC 19936]|uniref:Integrase n=1 Tax=Knoellia sinensis KCTC 19936 TaxID=1385520 RepID=A0A0A0J509_9MICO|nr:hypothetical protein N802_18235 [Knoellia sinensis KCTC 19936]